MQSKSIAIVNLITGTWSSKPNLSGIQFLFPLQDLSPISKTQGKAYSRLASCDISVQFCTYLMTRTCLHPLNLSISGIWDRCTLVNHPKSNLPHGHGPMAMSSLSVNRSGDDAVENLEIRSAFAVGRTSDVHEHEKPNIGILWHFDRGYLVHFMMFRSKL